MNVKDILLSLGYKVTEDGKYWRAKPLYRESHNPTSLRISKSNGNFIDFSMGCRGSLEELVQLTLQIQDIAEAKKWLDSKQFKKIKQEIKPKIQVNPTWKRSILDKFIKDHSYWQAKNVSLETVATFEGGIFNEWKMNNRYVFPIFDNYDRIIGFSGRALTNKNFIKWKHIGRKQKWVWPTHLNRSIILEKRETILVESPACVLKLWDCGIKTAICLFGTELSDAIICFLVGAQPERIIIATNNEPDNKNIGNQAAIKIQKRLTRFVNPEKIKVFLPFKKDFGEMNKEEIESWYNRLYL